MAFPTRDEIKRDQVIALQALLRTVSEGNAFYQAKYAAGMPVADSLDSFVSTCPFTEKAELVADQNAKPPFGSNLSYDRTQYTRFHQTSGSSGKPMRWLDDDHGWQGMVDSWAQILKTVDVGSDDICFFAFSFGPFLGFWTAFEAGRQRGSLCIPGGGMRTSARLKTVLENGVTALFCTPTYAIHMGQTAKELGLDMSESKVRAILVAGEPGGSLPKTRAFIESLWPGAHVYDHHGMTEIGPVSLPCPVHKNRLHIMENAYFPEILDKTGSPVQPGQPGELILTGLHRPGSPLIRYKTGDLVRGIKDEVCECGRADMALDGGILGRIDDMVVVRGVNLYPSAVEEIVRRFSEVVEYQVHIDTKGSLSNIALQVELDPNLENDDAIVEKLTTELTDSLQLRVDVTRVASESLPRFELKARRWKVTDQPDQ